MIRFNPLASVLALVLILAPSAGRAAAQTLPGYHGDYDQAQLQYRAYALEAFQEVLTGWAEAVRAHDLDRAMTFYSDDVTAYLGRPAVGRPDVREALADWTDSIDAFRMGLADFDASGSMAYGAVRLVVNAVDPDQDGDGTLVLILKRRGNHWEIRSQTLVMSERDGGGSFSPQNADSTAS